MKAPAALIQPQAGSAQEGADSDCEQAEVGQGALPRLHVLPQRVCLTRCNLFVSLVTLHGSQPVDVAKRPERKRRISEREMSS